MHSYTHNDSNCNFVCVFVLTVCVQRILSFCRNLTVNGPSTSALVEVLSAKETSPDVNGFKTVLHLKAISFH